MNTSTSTKNLNSRSDDDVLVRVEGVSKKFCRDLKKSLWYGVCDIVSELNPFARERVEDESLSLGGESAGDRELQLQPSTSTRAASLREGEFWAVSDVSFELRRGECLGLIGRNGAGKTTLLKMLNGLIRPDGGRITMRGRIGALIALGAGFNPVLTGRENIYVNGAVLGLGKKEVEAKFDEIVEFSGVGEFIDSPVRSYSSGMNVRLGFAVATAMDPDVLILDEVLAVGDAAFRAKCYERMAEIRSRAAMIFVSHNMDSVAQTCSKILVMKKGRMVSCGEVSAGIQEYNRLNEEGKEMDGSFVQTSPGIGAVVTLVHSKIPYGGTLAIRIESKSETAIPVCDVKVVVFDSGHQRVCDSYTKLQQGPVSLSVGDSAITAEVGPLYLRKGKYTVSMALLDRATSRHLVWTHLAHQFEADGPDIASVSTCPPIRMT